jgi:hypothetical protein
LLFFWLLLSTGATRATGAETDNNVGTTAGAPASVVTSVVTAAPVVVAFSSVNKFFNLASIV